MYDACICLYCMYLLVFSAGKVARRIDTDIFCEIHAIHTKYISKYSSNTYKYMHIHTPKFKNPLFSKRFFSVCILFVFVCIVSIFIYVVSRYMSHTLELLCACMCMYCMYVHVFFSMHFLQICQSDFLGGKHV